VLWRRDGPHIKCASLMENPQERSICTGQLQWSPSPVDEIVQIDVPSDVGDCFFACVAVWLNVYLGRTLFDARHLRMCVAAALGWREAREILDRVREDLCHFCNMASDASLYDMQRVIMETSTWADHPIMSIMALFCTKLLGTSLGFIVLQFTADGRGTHALTVGPPASHSEAEQDLRIACVLFLTPHEHYLLLADEDSRDMIFDVKTQNWRALSRGHGGCGDAPTAALEVHTSDEECSSDGVETCRYYPI